MLIRLILASEGCLQQNSYVCDLDKVICTKLSNDIVLYVYVYITKVTLNFVFYLSYKKLS